MDQQSPPHRSSGNYGVSPTISPDAGSWWREEIRAALGRLEMGQILNRKAGEARVEGLRQHMDSRIGDLRTDFGGQIARLEGRVTTIERTSASTPAAASPPPPSTPAEHLPPWWQVLGWREPLLWLAAFLTALDVIKVESLERVLRITAGALGLK